MKLRQVYRLLYGKIIGAVKPLKYAKKIGVNMAAPAHIYGRVSWGSEPWLITLGKNVFITDGVKFVTHDGGTLVFRPLTPDLEITKPITVGDDVYIGTNAILLPGVNIGSGVVIGAGAVVTKDIPAQSVAVGVPARVIKTTDAYYEKLKAESLHLGHLSGQEKDLALMKHFGYTGGSKGVYF